jgi:hypothetical protein
MHPGRFVKSVLEIEHQISQLLRRQPLKFFACHH